MGRRRSIYLRVFINMPVHTVCGCTVFLVFGASPRANDSKEMISNTYYLLNKAENRVLFQFQPAAKTNLAPLILPKRENNLNSTFKAVGQEEQPFCPTDI